MEQLRALFEALKFADVSTFIASGNVVFHTAAKNEAALESKIEAHLEKSLGYAVDTFVRSELEVANAIQNQPFAARELRPEATLHVAFLREPLAPALAREVISSETEVDRFGLVGRELYWLCQIRTVDSKVWSSPTMKRVNKLPMTMRNLSSLRKLAAQYGMIKP
jgi:uncharacterized protein (DUF1697 family)